MQLDDHAAPAIRSSTGKMYSRNFAGKARAKKATGAWSTLSLSADFEAPTRRRPVEEVSYLEI